MGSIKWFSSSSFDVQTAVSTSNPDPTNWKRIRDLRIGRNLVIWLNYPDCKNYEGDKILVFEKCGWSDLVKQKKIDPHFSTNKNFKSPIARFEPSERGWDWAVNFATTIKS